MSFPVRCFTCGKVIGSFEQKYKNMLESGLTQKETLDALGMTRYCSRRMFLGYVDVLDQVNLFSKPIDNISEQKNVNTKN